MDYERLKGELREISEIAASVPEQFREKCFEILLQHLLESGRPANKKEPEKLESKPTETGTGAPVKIPVKSQLRVFLQRTSITSEQLEQLLLVDGEDVHFIREPVHGKVTKGQMEWALLLSLKQAILQNEFSTDPEDLRSICQDKGFYDKANFAATFKRPPYDGYFKQPLQPQGLRQTLSNDGQTALAELIRSLTKKSE